MEDGFIRIATELHQAIAQSRMTGRERAIVDAVIRFTYGWQRKSARISGDTFAEWTGLDRSDCNTIVTELVRRKILLRSGSRSPISLNKDYSQWEKPKGATRRVKRKSAERGEKHPSGESQVTTPQWGENPPTERGDNHPTYIDKKDNPSFANAQSGGACEDELPKIELASQQPKPAAKAKPYPDDFEQAWQAYPKRAGSNPKNHAFQAWQARRKEGVPAERMLEGVRRYVAFCNAKGSAHTEFVMQAKRFFGPSLEFDNDWSLPTAQPRSTRTDGRMGFAQPLPVGSYTPTNEDDLPEWARGLS
ncbi:replication protein [Modicisalibacter xianhensis]|uniref:replication protein n=1 Tax=Modicisalibacter xianhensis TaxID=442341 RepID=UPI0014170F04|nr:replication protein [Halomonas xianhensis]